MGAIRVLGQGDDMGCGMMMGRWRDLLDAGSILFLDIYIGLLTICGEISYVYTLYYRVLRA